MAESFTQIHLPQQKSFSSIPFPVVLSPTTATTLDRLLLSVKAQIPYLLSHLHESGAILFRGFQITSSSDFNDFVEAFDFDELPYIGGAAPRTRVIDRVFTANESPPDQKIHFHHEMARLPEFPSKLFFFCEIEPESEGETPIVLSHIVYDKMKEKYPDFVQKLEDHGLTYSRVFGEEDDPSSPIGRGWKSTFGTEDKTVAQERAAGLGMHLEWTAQGVKSIIGPIPAVKYDESRRRKIWFNSMVGEFTFGNGEPCPSEVINDCQRVLEDESVAIPWKTGDVLLIDNLAVLHARRSSIGARRILASICK